MMLKKASEKYRPYPLVDLPDRQWPSRTIEQAPVWCSVDLRDGNQALAVPMSVEEKLEMFDLLVKLGFKEIEVGFPSASEIEFEFTRRLIEENRIPEDVAIQVLVQSKEPLLRRTFEAINGAKTAIVHLYNSTSPAQRKITFGLEKEDIIKIATTGTEIVKSLVPTVPDTKVRFQYSPESFSATEVDFALEVCEAVMDVWGPTSEEPMILNLPATVEIFTPNVHADQIEWFCRNLKNRDSAIISLHTHNDRGTGTAATELGLLAGAQRVEGTLFGNGERTGNLDIVTVAMNMYATGVDPLLDFSDIPHIRSVYEKTTRMRVPERHPYSGDLVFTAFSGSHQDAINKGFKHVEKKAEENGDGIWEVPYLYIDPADIGRTYDAIIRINSQSGKGGVAYMLEMEHGYILPKTMHPEFGRIVNKVADQHGHEVSASELYEIFEAEYINQSGPMKLLSFRSESELEADSAHSSSCATEIELKGEHHKLHGMGDGPIEAFVRALDPTYVAPFKVLSYSEHALGEGAEAKAVAYVQIESHDGSVCFGVGVDTNITFASIKAVVSALNRTLS